MGAWGELAHILRVYWPLLLGNIIEWYEFAIYGYLERFLEDLFFQGSAIGAWVGFGVTFVSRPLGGAIFGAIADVYGRRTAVNLTIVGMLVGTCGQGCLPTYAGGETAGGIGLSLLVALRLLQGMCAAGEISTVCTYIAEVGSRETLGRSMSLVAITSNAGFLLAKTVSFLVVSAFGEDGVRAWAWRVPFIVALAPGLTAVWGRGGMPESAAFVEEKARKSGGAPARHVIWAHRLNLLVAVGAVVSPAFFCYGGFVWTNTYLLKRGLAPEGAMLASLCARFVMIGLALPVGWLVDVAGIAFVAFVATAGLAVGGLPLFAALAARPASTAVAVAVVGAGYGTLGAVGGCFFLYVVELFPGSVRAAALGVSYNVSVSIFGGLAPVAAEASLRLTPLGPGLLLSLGGGVTASTIIVALLLERRGSLTLAHLRQHPYFLSVRLRGEERAPEGKWETVEAAEAAEEASVAKAC